MRRIPLVLALTLTLFAAAASVHAGTQTGPIVVCTDGAAYYSDTALGVCEGDGGIQGYQNVTAVCTDGWLSQIPAALGACADHGGVDTRVEQPVGAATATAPYTIVALPPSGISFPNPPAVLPSASVPVITVGGPPGSPVNSVVLIPAPVPSACVSYTGGPCVTRCVDGLWSSSTGRGTCSRHGGEAR